MRQDHVAELALEGYTLTSELSRSDVATVYLAEHGYPSHQVAVKVLAMDVSDPTARSRFEQACASMLRLSSHPYVVDVLDARVSSGGFPFIVMRLYEGSTLAQFLRVRGPLASAEATHVGFRIAEALVAGHDIGVTHGDVKPENVLLDRDGESFLSDVGIAALADADQATMSAALTNRSHVAPEVSAGNERSPLSDVYSLASTLYQALTGHPPVAPYTPRHSAVAATSSPAPTIARTDLQPGLQDVILRGLEADPARRWPSMSAFARALHRVAAEQQVPVPPPRAPAAATEPVSAVPSSGRPRRTVRWAVLLVIVAVVAGAVGLYLLLSGDGDPDSPSAATVALIPSPTTAPETEPELEPKPKQKQKQEQKPKQKPTAEPATEEAEPEPQQVSLVEQYAIGDCLDATLATVDCSTPHLLQVTGFAKGDFPCIVAGESFVGRDATFTTRIVHDRVLGSEIDPSFTGGMCVSGLVDRGLLQTVDFGLYRTVADTLASARLVGGCQSDSGTAALGDALDLGPCSSGRPWLSGHFWKQEPFPADPPACRNFSARMDGRPYVVERMPHSFDTAALWQREVDRKRSLEADEESSYFVPRIEVELPSGETETFEAATAQAMPIPRPEDHPSHFRLVCGVKVY